MVRRIDALKDDRMFTQHSKGSVSHQISTEIETEIISLLNTKAFNVLK